MDQFLLPSASTKTALPIKYEAAKVAIAECDRIDECKSWVDKAAALAAYARQAEEKELEHAAARIRARATRRCGELLNEIEKMQPKDSGKLRGRGDTSLTSPRKHAAEKAGLSDDQSKDAIRVANIPAERFEELVESYNPPSITFLAGQGTIKKTPHVGQNTGENEWYTPPEIIEAARKVMGGIDCDPASSKIANRTVKAATFYTAKDDGLKQPWKKCCYLNPPYSQPLVSLFAAALAEKLRSREITQAVVLVNNATETGWFREIVSVSNAVCFPANRIKFLDPSGAPSGTPLQGQAILYAGNRIQLFCKEFAQFGWLARL